MSKNITQKLYLKLVKIKIEIKIFVSTSIVQAVAFQPMHGSSICSTGDKVVIGIWVVLD